MAVMCSSRRGPLCIGRSGGSDCLFEAVASSSWPSTTSKFLLRRMLTGKTTPTPTSRSGCPSRSAAATLRQRGRCRFRCSFPRTRRFGRDAAGDSRRLCEQPFEIRSIGTLHRTLRSQKKGVATFVLVVDTMVCSGTARSVSRFPTTIAITITITITIRIPRPERRMKLSFRRRDT